MGIRRQNTWMIAVQVDENTALKRFRAHMTRGLLRPPTLKRGTWANPELVTIPVCSASARASSNWTAESGTKSGKKYTWTPLTGQHQEDHAGLVFLISKPWARHKRTLFAAIQKGNRADMLPEVRSAETTWSDAEIKKKAEKLVREAEKAACAKMIPGKPRRLAVNTTIDKMALQTILVPVYEVSVDDNGHIYKGWVDATTGKVHARKVTSYKRVAVGVGALLGLAAMFVVALGVVTAISGQLVLAAAEADRVEHQHEVAERARVLEEELHALEAEWSASKEQLTKAIIIGQAALAKRELDKAREAVSESSETMTRLRDRVEQPDLEELWTRYEAFNTELERVAAVKGGLVAAKAVAANSKKCTTVLEIKMAWEGLSQVTADDPERREAIWVTRKLERCRAKTERELSASLRKVMVDQRLAMAPKLERGFLDKGFDVRVRVEGSNKNVLRMTWVLFGRATVHQVTDGGSMSKGSFLRNLQDGGFRKVIFSDGYSESIFYDLEPEPEGGGGKTILAGMGLGEPLSLSE